MRVYLASYIEPTLTTHVISCSSIIVAENKVAASKLFFKNAHDYKKCCLWLKLIDTSKENEFLL